MKHLAATLALLGLLSAPARAGDADAYKPTIEDTIRQLQIDMITRDEAKEERKLRRQELETRREELELRRQEIEMRRLREPRE